MLINGKEHDANADPLGAIATYYAHVDAVYEYTKNSTVIQDASRRSEYKAKITNAKVDLLKICETLKLIDVDHPISLVYVAHRLREVASFLDGGPLT